MISFSLMDEIYNALADVQLLTSLPVLMKHLTVCTLTKKIEH
jgi:hypothetical protein